MLSPQYTYSILIGIVLDLAVTMIAFQFIPYFFDLYRDTIRINPSRVVDVMKGNELTHRSVVSPVFSYKWFGMIGVDKAGIVRSQFAYLLDHFCCRAIAHDQMCIISFLS